MAAGVMRWHAAEAMNSRAKELLDRLWRNHALDLHEYEFLITALSSDLARYAAELASAARHAVWGDRVFVRGLIELSSFCSNDCLYCGIRRSNRSCQRYRLLPEQVLACANEGYELGFRTFVLQGGQDPWFTDERLTALIGALKEAQPDCAITLSLGERSRQSYERLFAAGAERYLLRHETADPVHYAYLHPKSMSWKNRMRCLEDLHDIGYATGAGFMVGSPGQTPAMLAADLKFIERFRPEMCGIGPFIPHSATPFAAHPAGSADLTLFLLSLLRLIDPCLLLPATTALNTLHSHGHQQGILAGANVIMPNLSPFEQRAKYEIYEKKLSTGAESAQGIEALSAQLEEIGCRLCIDRGDPPRRQAVDRGDPPRRQTVGCGYLPRRETVDCGSLSRKQASCGNESVRSHRN